MIQAKELLLPVAREYTEKAEASEKDCSLRFFIGGDVSCNSILGYIIHKTWLLSKSQLPHGRLDMHRVLSLF